MAQARRLSPQTAAVLAALAADPSTWRYGYELGQQVGLKAGTLYPILMRLSDRGLLEASLETNPPPGRPPRHLYRLTGVGVRLAEAMATEAATAGRRAGRTAGRTAGRRAGRTAGARARDELRGAW
jgi:PadR family transcriptional regulator PadR